MTNLPVPTQLTSKRVLIVEDEAIIGMALAADLEELGFEVEEIAASGEEAVEIIKEKEIGLLLLDIKLSGKWSGIDTLQEIRKHGNPVVIIISGNSEKMTYKRATDLQVNGFLVKPVNIKDLKEVLQAIREPQPEG